MLLRLGCKQLEVVKTLHQQTISLIVIGQQMQSYHYLLLLIEQTIIFTFQLLQIEQMSSLN